ncbi:hypothetical protein NDA18_006157 [Ustilago nuda]|nr:hypothetical protein NDA18_006157 [Ustilago nuda]
MSAAMVPDLDAPARALSLLRTITPDDMIFLHRGQTQEQLVKVLYNIMHAPQPRRNRIWLLASEFQVIVTFLVCTVMLIKKRSLGKLWIITKRDSCHGTFYVANSVFVLVVGVAVYLVAWGVTTLVIAAFSYAHLSTMEWWWVIPLPAIGLVSMSGYHYYHAKYLARKLLSLEILHEIHALAHNKAKPFADDQLVASDQLIYTARRVTAAYLESHRYVCINLAIFAAAAWVLFIPCIIYGLPNIVSLVDHVCSRYPDPLPPNCTTFFQKLLYLITKGRPSSSNNSAQINLATWKMTILAIVYVNILVFCIPAFAFVPIYIVAGSYPKGVLNGDIAPVMTTAVLAISLITIASCTFFASFCTVATLDPLFRAAIGLNVIRTHNPKDITVVQHRSRQEHKIELGLTSPSMLVKQQGQLSLSEVQPVKPQSERMVAFKASMSTITSRKVDEEEEKEEDREEDKIHYPDYPREEIRHFQVDGAEEMASPNSDLSFTKSSI